MYLNLLNEKEKSLFLDFAQYVSGSDGNVGVEETEMLKAYCAEMSISVSFDKPNKTVEELIDEINSVCDERSKKIIVFELIGLALSDNNYDVFEKQLIDNAVETFRLDLNYPKSCEDIISDYISFQNRINKLILG